MLSDACVHGYYRSTHLRLYIRRCMHPTRSLLSDLQQVSWYIFVEAQDHVLRAYTTIRRTTGYFIIVTCLYICVTTVRNYRLCDWTALLVRNPAEYFLPVLVRVASMSCVVRPHNTDCYASASSVVLSATESGRVWLLYCSRYCIFITTMGWCFTYFLTIPDEVFLMRPFFAFKL